VAGLRKRRLCKRTGKYTVACKQIACDQSYAGSVGGLRTRKEYLRYLVSSRGKRKGRRVLQEITSADGWSSTKSILCKWGDKLKPTIMGRFKLSMQEECMRGDMQRVFTRNSIKTTRASGGRRENGQKNGAREKKRRCVVRRLKTEDRMSEEKTKHKIEKETGNKGAEKRRENTGELAVNTEKSKRAARTVQVRKKNKHMETRATKVLSGVVERAQTQGRGQGIEV